MADVEQKTVAIWNTDEDGDDTEHRMTRFYMSENKVWAETDRGEYCVIGRDTMFDRETDAQRAADALNREFFGEAEPQPDARDRLRQRVEDILAGAAGDEADYTLVDMPFMLTRKFCHAIDDQFFIKGTFGEIGSTIFNQSDLVEWLEKQEAKGG